MTKTRTAILGLLAAASIAGVAVGAHAQMTAQNAAPAARPDRPDRQRNIDPAAMKARMDERHAARSQAMKDVLAITPAQDDAWTTFQASMKPPTRDAAMRPTREAMEKLTTPQRLDHQLQQANTRHAAVTARINATKTFYAQLSPAQKKAFDALPHIGGGRDHGGRGGRGMGMDRKGGRGDHMGPGGRGGRGGFGEGRGPGGGPRGERPAGPAA